MLPPASPIDQATQEPQSSTDAAYPPLSTDPNKQTSDDTYRDDTTDDEDDDDETTQGTWSTLSRLRNTHPRLYYMAVSLIAALLGCNIVPLGILVVGVLVSLALAAVGLCLTLFLVALAMCAAVPVGLGSWCFGWACYFVIRNVWRMLVGKSEEGKDGDEVEGGEVVKEEEEEEEEEQVDGGSASGETLASVYANMS